MRTLLSFLGPLRSPVVVFCAAGSQCCGLWRVLEGVGGGVQFDHTIGWKR